MNTFYLPIQSNYILGAQAPRGLLYRQNGLNGLYRAYLRVRTLCGPPKTSRQKPQHSLISTLDGFEWFKYLLSIHTIKIYLGGIGPQRPPLPPKWPKLLVQGVFTPENDLPIMCRKHRKCGPECIRMHKNTQKGVFYETLAQLWCTIQELGQNSI